MRAIVTGAGGQDGTLMCGLLRSKGLEVLGIGRPRKPGDLELTDDAAVSALIRDFAPDRIFHLAAAHHSSEEAVDVDFERQMIETNFRAAEVLVASVAKCRPGCRLLLAGTSQMFRAAAGERRVIDEATPMSPSSFYGRTKAWSRELLAHFRDKWGVFGGTAILFNHESVLRPEKFVTRKVTMAAARAKTRQPVSLELLDLDGSTDWSDASDVVEGMRRCLEADAPADYVLASGRAHSIRELLETAFGAVGLDWRNYVQPRSVAPNGRGVLTGDATRARQRLGWEASIPFETTIREMVAHDVALLQGSASR
jgi:GDPmannose 4,6-dehydratase